MKLDQTIQPTAYNSTESEVEKDLTEQFQEEEKPEANKSFKRAAAIAGAAVAGVAGAGAIYAATNDDTPQEEEIEEIVFEEDETVATTPAARHHSPATAHVEEVVEPEPDRHEDTPDKSEDTTSSADELRAINEVRGEDELPVEPTETTEPVEVNIDEITGDVDPNQATGSIIEGELVDEIDEEGDEIIIDDQFIDADVDTTQIIVEEEVVEDCSEDVIAEDPFIDDL